ncbi:MAG TPA: DUF5986 family protein [Ureibacillus sp.]|nr:DUF5986 family protein [Ureibacillus sp.]
MKISLGINQEVIGELVKAFSDSTTQTLNEVIQEQGWETGNFKNGANWDTRFKRLKKVALQNNLVVLTRKRGIWTFIVLLNIQTGVMYVFSKEKNIEIVKRNFGKKKIHYFHAFLSLNSGPVELDNQQLEFFPKVTDDYDARRIFEVQKILGEEYPLVKQVVFVVAKEEGRKIIGVEAQLYNRYFGLLDSEDWTSSMSVDQYDDLLEPAEQTFDEDDISDIIPKVKQTVKDRKNHFDKKIAQKKKETEQSKEEES